MNFTGCRFRNAYAHTSHGLLDVLRWKLGAREKARSSIGPGGAETLPLAEPAAPTRRLSATPAYGSVRLTWIGHSTFLLQHLGRAILTDPIFSDCQPLPISTLRRVRPPGVRLQDLPRIDDVLISHSHYDHLDAPTVRALGGGVRYWVPEGLAGWFRRRKVDSCTEVRWWQSCALSDEIAIHCVPAQHASGRTPFDRNRTHWCGWVLQSAERTVYFAGDTGYSPSFCEIGERFGGFDAAMIPIGAYSPRWLMKPMHLDLAEAVQAHIDIRSKHSIACHWGTYRLTDELLDEPPRELARELALRHIDANDFRVLQPGETLEI